LSAARSVSRLATEVTISGRGIAEVLRDRLLDAVTDGGLIGRPTGAAGKAF
jgi:hypothetical protein